MKKVIRYAWEGIRTAAVIFLLLCIIMGLAGGKEQFSSGYGMARAGAAVLLIGIGFGVPALVYETKLRMGLKVLIHMGIGCTVMTAASILGGWLPADRGLAAVLTAVAIEFAFAFAAWGIDMFGAIIQAKRINEKIAEKKEEK